jgi:DNA-directed RNA polymerase specialized sigma subunit
MNNYKRRPKTKNEVEKERKEKTNNIYFSAKHEKAIIEYVNTVDRRQRELIYREFIEPVFDQMVNKIVFTYKFNLLPNIEDLKMECKGWLTTVLEKFDPSKGSKAFSYFSVITKNWFIHKVKKNTDKIKREAYFEDLKKESQEPELIVNNDYDDQRDSEEYWNNLYAELLDWQEDESIKPNEKKVLQAIMLLMENQDKIEIFNKKAIYLYIREMTGLNTKQVASNLTLLKKRYKIFRGTWLNDVE